MRFHSVNGIEIEGQYGDEEGECEEDQEETMIQQMEQKWVRPFKYDETIQSNNKQKESFTTDKNHLK